MSSPDPSVETPPPVATAGLGRRAVGRIVGSMVRIALLVVVPLVALVIGLEMYVAAGRVVSTENAYVKSDKVAVSSDLEGRVVSVNVKAHDRVEKGAELFTLDRRPFEIALQRADAEIGVVANEIRGYYAAYRMELSSLEMAQDNLGYFEREYARQRKLSSGGLVAKSQHDSAQHEVQMARQRIAGIREEIGNALSRIGGDPAQPVEAHPRYRQAVAARDAALLDLERTVIRAPVTGTVSSVELQAGEYVESGQPVFSIVADENLWVTANLKETELTHVHVGQAATITADAFPDRHVTAEVESIAPATGAEFSLLPPQNASGNWVKVVQRIPVRLKIPAQAREAGLRVGMSVQVEIETGQERQLPEVLRSAMALIRAGQEQLKN